MFIPSDKAGTDYSIRACTTNDVFHIGSRSSKVDIIYASKYLMWCSDLSGNDRAMIAYRG
jgi:hypothetical protein